MTEDITQKWNEARLQQYIDDEVQENLSLDYKRGTFLSNEAKKNKKNWLEELTKDMSAMANSAGGILIYGIAEENDLPTEFSPVDKTEFTRERLDQIISSNIKPRIDGLEIHPVPLNSGANDIAYVIEIPQSQTAHQASDKRYHKRLNTTTVWMEDYEIRDVMGRGQHPKIELEFEFEFRTEYVTKGIPYITTDGFGRTEEPEEEAITEAKLIIRARNTGNVFANYVNTKIIIPTVLIFCLLSDDEKRELQFQDDEGNWFINTEHNTEIIEHNTTRDVVDWESKLGYAPIYKYGPARYTPILPTLAHHWELEVDSDKVENLKGEQIIAWKVFADNAPATKGFISVKNILIQDKRTDVEGKHGNELPRR